MISFITQAQAVSLLYDLPLPTSNSSVVGAVSPLPTGALREKQGKTNKQFEDEFASLRSPCRMLWHPENDSTPFSPHSASAGPSMLQILEATMPLVSFT